MSTKSIMFPWEKITLPKHHKYSNYNNKETKVREIAFLALDGDVLGTEYGLGVRN